MPERKESPRLLQKLLNLQSRHKLPLQIKRQKKRLRITVLPAIRRMTAVTMMPVLPIVEILTAEFLIAELLIMTRDQIVRMIQMIIKEAARMIRMIIRGAVVMIARQAAALLRQVLLSVQLMDSLACRMYIRVPVRQGLIVPVL